MAANAEDETHAPQDNDEGVRLFSGIKMWFSHAVPQRAWLIENATLNGAEVVPLEKQADILIVDHTRKNQAPGTTSYQFVTKSILSGKLEDMEEHAVGCATRAARPVGSVSTASKGGRTAYTEAEDQFLWNIIVPYRDRGGYEKGNEIYKQIERMNSRHTFQSWRDRWIKHTQFQQRQVTEIVSVASAPDPLKPSTMPERQASRQNSAVRPVPRQTANATEVKEPQELPSFSGETGVHPPPQLRPRKPTRDETYSQLIRPLLQQRASQVERPSTPKQEHVAPQIASPMFTPLGHMSANFEEPLPLGFTKREAEKLYEATEYILSVDPTTWDESWQGIAKSNEHLGHTAQEWKMFWETLILPEWRSRRGKQPKDVVDPKFLGDEIEENAEADRDSEEVEENNVSRGALQTQADTDVADPGREIEAGDLEVGSTKIGAELSNDESGEDANEEVAHTEYDPKLQPGTILAKSTTADHLVEDEGSEAPTSPGAITCTKCFTDESRKWRRDKEGNLLCNECGWFLKSSGILRPSNAWTELGDDGEDEEEAADRVMRTTPSRQAAAQPIIATPVSNRADAGVQTSPVIPSASLYQPRENSPSFEPESPSSARPPAPNEARKRSAGNSSKSHSQESNKPTNDQQQAEMAKRHLVNRKSQFEEKQQETQARLRSPTPDPGYSTSRKKRRLQDEPTALEIPDTPEHKQDQSSNDVINAQGSFIATSPQTTGFRSLKHITPHSPMFVPQGSEDDSESSAALEERSLSATIDQEHSQTPLRVNLVGDGRLAASQSQQDRHQEDELSESETASQYAFETAPEISEEWETAPETGRRPDGEAQGRIETQAPFDTQFQTDLGGLEHEFALPEPTGGWELFEDRTEENQHGQDAGRHHNEDEEQDEDDDDDSTPELADIINGKDAERRKGKERITARERSRGRSQEAIEIRDSEDEQQEEAALSAITSLNSWRIYLKKIYPPHTLPQNIDMDALSLDAIKATSFDFVLGTTVFGRMLRGFQSSAGESLRVSWEIQLPDDIHGCWTQQDDEKLLNSHDPKDYDKLARKHGDESCNARFEFLEAWEKA